MRRFVAGVLGVALAASGAGCSRRALRPGEARLELDHGASALVADRGSRLVRTTSGRTLHRGARVRVLTGSALLRLPSDSAIEMRPTAEIRLEGGPVLVSGDILVTAPSRALSVDAGEGSADVTGAARIRRVLGLAVESYRGTTTVRSAERSLDVKAPRQAAVAALGVLPTQADPIAYDDRDSWDRRYLADAIELGSRLAAPARALAQSLRPGEGRTVGFYRQLLPALDQQPLDESLLGAVPGRRPDEGLVGASLTVAGHQGSFADRWRAVFGFRSQGAQWGLVALDQEVTDADGVTATLSDALNRAQLDFASPPAPTPTGSAPSNPGASPAPTTTTSTTAPRRPTTTTTTTAPSGPVPTPPATGTPLDPITQPIVQPVVDTLNGLLGGG